MNPAGVAAALKELMAPDTVAKELIKFATYRLNKFYNPKLYKALPKTESPRENRIVENMRGIAAPTKHLVKLSAQVLPSLQQ